MLSSAVSPARGRQRTNADVRYSQEASACVQRRLAGGDSIAAAVRRSNECPVRCKPRKGELARHRLLNAGSGRRTWSCNSVLPRPSSPLESRRRLSVRQSFSCFGTRAAALSDQSSLATLRRLFSPGWLAKGAALPSPSQSCPRAQCVTEGGERSKSPRASARDAAPLETLSCDTMIVLTLFRRAQPAGRRLSARSKACVALPAARTTIRLYSQAAAHDHPRLEDIRNIGIIAHVDAVSYSWIEYSK